MLRPDEPFALLPVFLPALTGDHQVPVVDRDLDLLGLDARQVEGQDHRVRALLNLDRGRERIGGFSTGSAGLVTALPAATGVSIAVRNRR